MFLYFRERLTNLTNPLQLPPSSSSSPASLLRWRKKQQSLGKIQKQNFSRNSAYSRIFTEHRLWGTTQTLLEPSAVSCVYLDVVWEVSPVAVENKNLLLLSVCRISYPNQITACLESRACKQKKRGTTPTARRYGDVIPSGRWL